MALYFLSDVHLRYDFPERAERLARLVSRLSRNDHIVVVGDLVDFWFASRERNLPSRACQGLNAVADFCGRGGSLTLLPGNHDGQLEDDFVRRFGQGFAGQHLDMTEEGRRIRAIHGHRVGVRSLLKSGMETRVFLHLFGAAPKFVARHLDSKLNRSNHRHRDLIDQGHLDRYRDYVRENRDEADLFVFGHVHRVVDEGQEPRMIVLGGWHQCSSYLKVDAEGARLIVEKDL